MAIKLPELKKKAKKIKLLIVDVDGVLTDGKIIFDSTQREIKAFDVKDGHGIKAAHRFGLEVAIITGRSSSIVDQRASELGIKTVIQKALDKKSAFNKILESTKLSTEEIAYIGDDLPDLPVLRRVGLSVAVSDAVQEVLESADMVTKRYGGSGAVREVIDFILKAQGKWDTLMERYYA